VNHLLSQPRLPGFGVILLNIPENCSEIVKTRLRYFKGDKRFPRVVWFDNRGNAARIFRQRIFRYRNILIKIRMEKAMENGTLGTTESTTELASQAFRRLLVLFRFLRQHAREMHGQGISPRDFSAMRFLLECGPATVGAVQAFIFRSPSTASALVDKLAHAGYVTRARSDRDNRVVLVDLTPAGRELLERTPLQGLPLLRRRLAELPPERLRRIDEALCQIMELMEVHDVDAIS
jgi:MarR family transcriptional regulator, organic hydroperoxide resistance regulator